MSTETETKPTWEQLSADRMARYEIENRQGWREEINRIPFIAFPAGWQIKVIPPFGDAVVRFQVKLPSGCWKSVYLDVRGSLGFFGADLDNPVPYWEVYPCNGDTGRCHLDDTEELLKMIATEEEDQ